MRPLPLLGGLSQHAYGSATVALGVFLISFDALLVRLAAVPAMDVAFWRGLFMALSLGGIRVVRQRQGRAFLPWFWADAATLGIGLLMGCASSCIVAAFTLTLTANAVLIFSAAPLVAAVFSWLFLREKSARRTLIAIFCGCAGVVCVVGGSLGGGVHVKGDLLAVTATLGMGIYLTLFRNFSHVSRLQCVAIGGLTMALIASFAADPWQLPGRSYAIIALMGAVQMPLALLLISNGTRYLKAPEVSLFLLGETLLAPIWVYLVLSEVPPEGTWLGGVLILGVILFNSLSALRYGGKA